MAKSRLQINVVQRDIDRAVRVDSSRCVVATAVARAVPDATRIEVDTQTIRFTSGGKRLAYLTPLTVQGYVAAFDAGDPIFPFSFQLREPIELRRKHVLDESKAKAAAARRQAVAAKKAAKETELSPADADDRGVSSVPAVSYAGIHSRYDPATKDNRVPPPRVFKLKARTYGHRQLRINRPKEGLATP